MSHWASKQSIYLRVCGIFYVNSSLASVTRINHCSFLHVDGEILSIDSLINNFTQSTNVDCPGNTAVNHTKCINSLSLLFSRKKLKYTICQIVISAVKNNKTGWDVSDAELQC